MYASAQSAAEERHLIKTLQSDMEKVEDRCKRAIYCGDVFGI